ncbi:MAG: Eco57I restriction-modification methylase domain-containing protein [Bacteroidales bacterium]|nr:Eco57I restriction-modification methylase domain-containing protein [Bacteroidales bacterium]
MLFQKNIVRKYLATLPKEQTNDAWRQYQQYFLNPAIQQNILQSKEEQFQEGFLRELFVNVLGYTLNPQPNYNLITEKKNETNSKKADGAILANEIGDDASESRVIGIIELKDHKTTDLAKIEAQAFGYKNQHVGTRLVIISNFEKLRLYIDNAVEYREWNLFTLTEDEFRELYLCLSWPQVKAGIAMQMKSASVSNEDQITKELYKDYSEFKRVLFADIVERNPDYDKLLLFKKTQKLLDRLLFIFFAEDCGLLPPNSIMQIIDQWEKLKEMDEYRPLYDRVKKYFGYMNTGFQGKKYEIFAYNGGLFKPDEVLDNIIISDEPLVEHIKRLSTYDFESEVDVNILGHIFENSLSEIEEVTQQIKEAKLSSVESKTTSKRKQDGVFYTPQYITKYIVENTVGRLCAEKKSELGIVDEEYFSDKKRQKETRRRLMEQLQQYREWLLQITICDPACGSGAFLNAALQFLMNEHRLIDEMEAKVTGSNIVFQNVENSILENNLFGVDINEESVEIAQLALWLRTAKPHRKLNTLSQNIKCGNSLISDPAIAGDKAFNWQEQFPKVFCKKHKKAWHITTATHDSRTSQRMIDYKVRLLRDNGMRPYADPMWLDPMEEKIVTETIAEIVKADRLNILAYNVCGDHMHLVLVCEEEEVPKIVGKVKSMTARAVNIAMGRTIPASVGTAGHAPLSRENAAEEDVVGTGGHAPLSQPTRGETQCSLWTRKYGCVELDSDMYLYNAIEYVKNNRKKHELPPLENIGIVPTVSVEEAFRPEYDGGFDVVIGNPPYVHLESVIETSNQLEKVGFSTYNKRGDLYCLFVEKAFQLAKHNGLISYIMPNKWLQAGYGKELRSFFLGKRLEKLIDFGDIQIFEGATTYPCIFVGRNSDSANQLSVSVLTAANSWDFNHNVASTEEIFDISQFSSDTWVISSQKEKSLLEKLSNNHKTLKDFVDGEAYRGVLTGLSEAFLIDSATYQSIIRQDERAKEHIYPFLQGRHITPYGKAEAVSYLILFEKGWTQRERSFESEADAWNYLKSQYPSIAAWLEPFADKGRKRTDKGDFWWELRACDYYEQFAKPKIMYQAFQVKPCFIYDEQGFYSNNSMWFIPTHSKSLLAILNSKMGWWLITKFCSQIQNGYQLIWKYFGQIPIPAINDDSSLSSLADTMLSLNADLQQKRIRFLRRLQENFCGGACPAVKITGALETFDSLQFADFLKELKKQKIKLTLPQQDEWEDYFNQYKTECNSLSELIAETDRKIDGMVYELYGLTEEEIKVVGE